MLFGDFQKREGIAIKKSMKSTKTREPIYSRIPPIIICSFLCISVLFAVPAEIILRREESYLVPCSSDVIVDLCLRSREILVFATAIFILLFWIGERIFPDHPQQSILFHNKRSLVVLILCGAYLLSAAISSVLGEYREISFWGFASESEGLAGVIGYIVLFLASYEYLRTTEAIRLMGNTVFIISAIINVLFLTERFFGPLIMLIFGVPDERTGTALLFGNSSNCGEVCVVLSVAAVGFAYCEQNRWLKYIKAILAGGLMLTAVTTFSSAAVYGMICGIVFTIILLLAKRVGNLKQNLMFAAAIAVPILLFTAIDYKSALTYISSDIANGGTYSAKDNFELKELSMENDILAISDSDNTMIIKAEKDGTFIFADGYGKELYRSSNGETTFEEPFSEISAEVADGIVTLELGYDSPISFAVQDAKIQFVGINGYLEPELSESAFPELSQFYSFGTGRGYIWLNSLPLLKGSVIIGRGAGQFPFYFPQNELVGMLNTHGNAPLLTDKPHCMYLGIAISYGIPALLVFLAIAVVSLKRGLCRYLHQPNGISATLLGSMLCFLVMGIANDSSPVYSPIFWVFAGIAATADHAIDDKA